jgi:phosphatidylserine/phosphatidylglycerophosphate/cardiolipin synthase-like enzyme
VRLDSNPYLMHHKVVIMDGWIVVTGSFNWSESAEERNDENIVVIYDEAVAGMYEQEFQRILAST